MTLRVQRSPLRSFSQVYHTFHEEFDHLHGHWWRCTGACRQWKPFFGYVKRSMNRAPSTRDRWWSKRYIRVFEHFQRCSSFMSGEHERRCGGTFEKIKEPADYKAKENRKRTTAETASDQPAASTQGRDERRVLTVVDSSLRCQRRRSTNRRAVQCLATAPLISFSRKRIQSRYQAMLNERIDNNRAKRAHRQHLHWKHRSRTKAKQTMPSVPRAMSFYPKLTYLFTKYDATSSWDVVNFLLLSLSHMSILFIVFLLLGQLNWIILNKSCQIGW